MVLGILEQLARDAKRKPKRPVYVNVMGLQRIIVNGKTMIVRRVLAVTGDSLIVEDASGKIVQLPLASNGQKPTVQPAPQQEVKQVAGRNRT